jgi:flavodoxin
MKAAIVVYTKTGNSATVARTLAAALRDKGHTADVLLIKTRGELNPGMRKVDFESIPSVEGYDTVVVGGPVWAFRASPALLHGTIALDSLEGKRAMVFVTHGLPTLFTGPLQALGKLSGILRRKKATVLDGVHIWCWTRVDQRKIDVGVATIAQRLGA